MIGAMRHRITFQQEVQVADDGGGYALSWEDIDETPDMWADVRPMSAGESLQYHKLTTTATHKIIIRYRSDITADMKILHGSLVYNIRSILNKDARGRFLEILAEEGVAI